MSNRQTCRLMNYITKGRRKVRQVVESTFIDRYYVSRCKANTDSWYEDYTTTLGIRERAIRKAKGL